MTKKLVFWGTGKEFNFWLYENLRYSKEMRLPVFLWAAIADADTVRIYRIT